MISILCTNASLQCCAKRPFACPCDLSSTVRIKIVVCTCLPNTEWRLKCMLGSGARRVFTKLCSHDVSLLSICCTQRNWVVLHLPLSQQNRELVGCNIGNIGPTDAVGAGLLLSQTACFEFIEFVELLNSWSQFFYDVISGYR